MCICACVCACRRLGEHVHAYGCAHVCCVCACLCVCGHACVFIMCLCVRVSACVHVCVCAHTCVYTCAHAHSHVCTRLEPRGQGRSFSSLSPVPSTGRAFSRALSGAWAAARGLPCQPSDAPDAESTLSLSSVRVRISGAAHLPRFCQYLLELGPCCLPRARRPQARRAVASLTACLQHSARLKVSRCMFGLKDDVFTERLHQQLQMTFQESNYSVSVFAEFRNR